MTTDAEEPGYIAAPYRHSTMEKLWSVACYGAGRATEAPGGLKHILADSVLGTFADFLGHVESGRIVFAPALLASGHLVVEIAVKHLAVPDPIPFTVAGAEALHLDPDEVALIYRQASASHRLAEVEVPDVADFETDLGAGDDVEDL